MATHIAKITIEFGNTQKIILMMPEEQGALIDDQKPQRRRYISEIVMMTFLVIKNAIKHGLFGALSMSLNSKLPM
jgi:hypothetical protein